MLLFIGQFGLGIIYGQWVEWILHKKLHKIGRKRESAFSYHFRSHHRISRQNMFFDSSYEGKGEGMRKELRDIVLLFTLHLPVLFFLPAFFVGSIVHGGLYFFLHRKCHLEPEWCKRYLPWHYDHHMALNQDANWGVTTDWIDRLMGTREIYLGTEREKRDTQRRMARQKIS